MLYYRHLEKKTYFLFSQEVLFHAEVRNLPTDETYQSLVERSREDIE